MYRNVPKLHYLHLPYLTESGIPCEWHWEHCSNERRPISDVYMFYNEFIIKKYIYYTSYHERIVQVR